MTYRLYVARDKRNRQRHDLGSLLCMQQLTHLPEGFVDVRECSKYDHPQDVTGTPTLVTDTEAYTGHMALKQLSLLSVQFAERHGREMATKGSSRPVAPHRPPVAAPPRAPSPPPEETAGVDSLFESQLYDEEVDETTRKITGDDLARLNQSREMRAVHQNPPPPPAPMKDV